MQDDEMTAVCVAVAWSRAVVGLDPSTRTPRHQEIKYDEIVSSPCTRYLVVNYLNSYVLLFVRSSTYSSTKARNNGDFWVERDMFLSEYNRHNDCSALTDYTRRK